MLFLYLSASVRGNILWPSCRLQDAAHSQTQQLTDNHRRKTARGADEEDDEHEGQQHQQTLNNWPLSVDL